MQDLRLDLPGAESLKSEGHPVLERAALVSPSSLVAPATQDARTLLRTSSVGLDIRHLQRSGVHSALHDLESMIAGGPANPIDQSTPC